MPFVVVQLVKIHGYALADTTSERLLRNVTNLHIALHAGNRQQGE